MTHSNGHPRGNDEIADSTSDEWDSLDFNELLNYSESHPEQKYELIRVYSRRFGRSMIVIQTARDNKPNDTSPRQLITSDKLYLRGHRMWLQYLNVFGSVTTKLKIYYSKLNETQCRELHHLIGQTCAVNLVEIQFIGIERTTPIDELENYQFPHVERIEILDSELSDRLPLFSKLFPNVRILKIINVKMDSFDAYFYHLHRFVIVRDDFNGVKNEINIICGD